MLENLADNGYAAPWVRNGRSFGPNVSALSFLRNFLVSKPRLSLIHDGRAGGLSQSIAPFPGDHISFRVCCDRLKNIHSPSGQ